MMLDYSRQDLQGLGHLMQEVMEVSGIGWEDLRPGRLVYPLTTQKIKSVGRPIQEGFLGTKMSGNMSRSRIKLFPGLQLP